MINKYNVLMSPDDETGATGANVVVDEQAETTEPELKSFTQEQLDDIIKREKAKAARAVRREYEAKLKETAPVEEPEPKDSDKDNELLAAINDIKKEVSSLRTEKEQNTLHDTALKVAAKMKIPEKHYERALKLIDLDGVDYIRGKPDPLHIQEMLEGLIEDFPAILGTKPVKSVGSSANPAQTKKIVAEPSSFLEAAQIDEEAARKVRARK